MIEDNRAYHVRTMIAEHVKSPSLRHIRDHQMIHALAVSIVERLDRAGPLWRKWSEPREALLKASAACWIPAEDMRAFLNEMEGPRLTLTDVTQRLRAFHEEPYTPYPDDDLREGCLAIYDREKATGTELPAIVGALQEYVEAEEERSRREGEERRRKLREEERLALEQRFLSGADCKWTPVDRSKELYCRMNGRTYRLSVAEDKRWNFLRVESWEDPGGLLIGKYLQRKDVTKALDQVAYGPELRGYS